MACLLGQARDGNRDRLIRTVLTTSTVQANLKHRFRQRLLRKTPQFCRFAYLFPQWNLDEL
jgi:hypothetical protein